MRFLGLSIALHALALVLAFLVVVERPSQPLFSQTPEAVIEVEVETIRVKPSPGTGMNTGGRHSRIHKKVELGDLGLHYDFSRGKMAVARPAAPHGDGSSGLLKELQYTSIYQEIYRRIDANVTYPHELKHEGIEGTVTARVSFSASGNYLVRQSTFASNSNFLRVVVMRALRKALAGGLPATMKKFHEPFLLDCTFHFAITEHDSESVKAASRMILGNNLVFYRNYQHSQLQFDLGPVSGMLGVPAIAFNPLWVVSKISDMLSNKSKIDPLQQFRDDPSW